MPRLARVRFTGAMNEPVTVSDDAVQSSVLAGAFHAAMFFAVAGAFLIYGLPRAAGAALLLGASMWAVSLLPWGMAWAVRRAMSWTVARFAQRHRARRPPVQREIPVSR